MKPPPKHRIAASRNRALAIALASICAGCGDGSLVPCSLGPDVDVSGAWTIEGTGERTDCTNPSYDGDFDFRLSQSPVVTHSTTGGVPSPEFSMDIPLERDGASLTLSGTVKGACVTFDLFEQSDAEQIGIHGSGTYSDGSISGEFSGSGPVGCTTSGRFTVDIR